MNYSFIYDEEELFKFYTKIVPELKDFEVFFLSLSCRKKYLNAEEREKFHITRAEMFGRAIVRKREWTRFLRTIRKYEVAEGGYLSKNALPIPAKCMVIYFNINPSNSLKSLQEFNRKVNDWQYELSSNNAISFKDKFNKLDVELMNCYQRNRGTKHWLDIDFDVPDDFNAPELLEEYLERTKLRYFWIDTKSGFHLLLDRNTLDFDPYKICNEGLGILWTCLCNSPKAKDMYPIERTDEKVITKEKSYEVVVNKNAMIPLPGTLQGEYPVKVLWKYSKERLISEEM
jgi:hypothetical protein